MVVQIDITFDDYPQDISWTLTNTCSGGEVVASGGDYVEQSSFTESYCVPNGTYNFTIVDSWGDGMCCSNGSGDYTVSKNGVEMISMDDGTNFGEGETKSFGSADDCAQTPDKPPTKLPSTQPTISLAPTQPPDEPPTKSPQPTNSAPTQSGTATIKVDITFDNYPEDVSWILFNTCNGDVSVASGGDYVGKDSTSETYDVSDGTFKFQIDDNWADGICCSAGEGEYSLYRNGAKMIDMTPKHNFGSGETRSFGSADNCSQTPAEPPTKFPTNSATIRVDITFDNWPEDTSWTLFNTCNGDVVVASGGDYGGRDSTFETYNVPDGTFKFQIDDGFGDGIVGEGEYSVYKNGAKMIGMTPGFNFGFGETKTFGSDDDCAQQGRV